MNAVSSTPSFNTDAFGDIYHQYLDNVSFLWILRSIAVDQPHYNLQDLRELEERIEAQLDGLMLSVEQSWSICEEVLDLHDPGELFAAAVIAFRSHDANKVQRVVEVGLEDDLAVKGLVSAMSWLPGNLLHGWLEKFINSKNLEHKYLAVAACGLRRENPGESLNRILQREDCQANVRLYARALKLAGEIRRQDLMPELLTATESEEADVQFWALWAAVLLGRHELAEKFQPFILSAGPRQQDAIELAFRVLPIDQARSLIAQLGKDPEQARAVIKACAVLGDPHAVNWLIARMEDDALARLSGEAFAQITGIDLQANGLHRELSDEERMTGIDEESDAGLSVEQDENLPWPDITKVKSTWINLSHRFIAGQRYFLGKNIQVDQLRSKLKNTNQRQRHAAALELALIDSSGYLQNTRGRVI